MAINKVILIGNLGQNPEVKTSSSGQSICNLSIATNESWTDRNGQKQEKTEWHRVVVFGKLAELCGQYLQKGRQAYIEGKLQTRSWQDKEGQTRYTTEVVAQQVQFLGGGATRSTGNEYGYSNPNQGQNNNSYGGQDYGNNMASTSFQAEPTFTEEDVPF